MKKTAKQIKFTLPFYSNSTSSCNSNSVELHIEFLVIISQFYYSSVRLYFQCRAFIVSAFLIARQKIRDAKRLRLANIQEERMVTGAIKNKVERLS